jgi:hypothetical protein
MVQSGIPFDLKDVPERQYKLLNQYLELMVDKQATQATRKETKSEESILK